MEKRRGRIRAGVVVAAAVPAGVAFAGLRGTLGDVRAACVVALFAVGLGVGRLAARLVEQLIAFEPVEDGESEAEPLPWRMRIPIVGYLLGGPYEPPLRWFERIPFVSLFAAAFVDARFSRLVPRGTGGARWIEVACAVLFAACGAAHSGWAVAASAFMGVALLVASAIDWRIQIIPDEVNCAALAGALAFALVTPIGLHGALEGALLGALALYLLGEVGRLVSGMDAMGGGDVKLIAAIGAFVGLEGVLWTLVVAAFAATPVGLWLRVTGRAEVAGGYTRMAFGPFLALGALVARFSAGA